MAVIFLNLLPFKPLSNNTKGFAKTNSSSLLLSLLLGGFIVVIVAAAGVKMSDGGGATVLTVSLVVDGAVDVNVGLWFVVIVVAVGGIGKCRSVKVGKAVMGS